MANKIEKKKPVFITSASVQILSVQQQIYVIRGKQVMMDRDLAALYGVETRVLKQAVKRNPERFPEEFMFQLDSQEFEKWRSQCVTSNSDKKGLRHSPYVFTEQGVAMLSAVLKSPTAISVSIGIMNAFVAARRILAQHDKHEMAIGELQLRMKMLEDALANNIGTVDNISANMKEELKKIYKVLGVLSERYIEHKEYRHIGYEAIDAQRKAKDNNNDK